MPDDFTEVTRVGLGTKIQESLSGVIVGLLMFFGSFVILWINESRVNLAQIAKTSIEVSPNKIDSSADGKLVSVSGNLTTKEMLQDPQFLKEGPYIKLSRTVEMFAWQEIVSTETEKEFGGGEKRITKYHYEKAWTTHPASFKNFKYPKDHENPALMITSKTFLVKSAKVGVYNIDPQKMILPAGEELNLSDQNVILKNDNKIENDYIFIGKGSLYTPEVGDIRISFNGLNNNIEVTTFGKLKGDSIVPFIYKDKVTLYRSLNEDRQQAIATLQAEHKFITWILRFLGFFLMWIGMALFLGPLTTILDIIPILGTLGKGLIFVITMPIALVLSIITIVLSMIFHNVIALIVALTLMILGLIFWIIKKRKKYSKQDVNL